MSREKTSTLRSSVQPKLLKDYLKEVMTHKTNSVVEKVTTFKTTYQVDIEDVETGEIYFSGDISWIAPEFVSDKLVYDCEEIFGHTIYVREVE